MSHSGGLRPASMVLFPVLSVPCLCAMHLESEIAFHQHAPELTWQVVRTTPDKFAEYAHPPHPATDPLHFFLTSIHRLKPRRIYELGAGAGELTTRLAMVGYEMTAVELSPDLLGLAQRRAKLDGVDGSHKVCSW